MLKLKPLIIAAYGMHMADQIAVVAVPLIAALVFDASPEIIGILVACQALAHLLGSIPSGVLVDRLLGKEIVCAAAAISAVGFLAATISVLNLNLIGFAIATVVAGLGIVLFVIASLSIIPLVVTKDLITKANSKIEMARAIPMSIAPLLVGWLAGDDLTESILFGAVLFSLMALIAAFRIPAFSATRAKRSSVMTSVVSGGRFVLGQKFLRPIAACAIFWNFAFSALLAVLAPFLLGYHNADPGDFGVALSIFGIGMIVGAFAVERLSDVIRPNIILIFGPVSSLIALSLLVILPAGGPVTVIYAAFFLLGFGPMMWMVVQNSVRQLVTPKDVLGRVNAVIQTAIYGVRPLGAIAGGFVAGATSPYTAVIFVAVLFGCSALVAVISPLRSLLAYSDLQVNGVTGTEQENEDVSVTWSPN